MDEQQGRTTAAANTSSRSLKNTIVYIFRQFLDLPYTVFILTVQVLLPQFRDKLLRRNMGKSFNPATDIPSLNGKVVVVTGGMYSPLLSLLTTRNCGQLGEGADRV